MKTPEQIAYEVMHSEGRFNFGPAEDVVIQMIRDAIKAYRAQNPGPSFSELNDMLEQWEDYSGDVSAFIQRFEDAWAR